VKTNLTKVNANKKNNKRKTQKKFTKKLRKVLANKFKPQILLAKTPTTKWEIAAISILTTPTFKKLSAKASKMFETTEKRKFIQV